MEIGRFYFRNKKYIAALNRFKIVVDKYSQTKFTPEALHRMVEAYYEMGMYEESYNTAALLGYNYSNSKWYKLSYNLVEQIDSEETFLKKLEIFLMDKEEIILKRLKELADLIKKHNYNYQH